jgi:hypothetical protein
MSPAYSMCHVGLSFEYSTRCPPTVPAQGARKVIGRISPPYTRIIGQGAYHHSVAASPKPTVRFGRFPTQQLAANTHRLRVGGAGMQSSARSWQDQQDMLFLNGVRAATSFVVETPRRDVCRAPQQKGSRLPEITDSRSGRGSSRRPAKRVRPASPRPTGPSSAGRSRRRWSGGPGS